MDFRAFEGINVHMQLENCLMEKDNNKLSYIMFGDKAYLNSPYMATLYRKVCGDLSKETKDDYNFHHFQLRIRIECTFGMLIQGWGLLKTPMPQNIFGTENY